MSYLLLEKAEHVARKEHQCIYCYESIQTGQRYFRERCLFEGEPQTNKWHPECWDDFLLVVVSEGGYAEYTPGEGIRPKSQTVFPEPPSDK